jgi:hypothetical protein
MASKFFKAFNFFKGKVSPTITSVKPTVNKSKINKAIGDVKLTALKVKGQMKKQSQDLSRDINKVTARIKQTSQKLKGEPVTKSGISKGKDLREKKMGGGMMGRRMGYSQGKLVGNQKKIDVAAPFGTINAKDFKKLREGKRMQAKDGTGPEQFMRSGVKEDPMRDRMKQPLKLKRSKALMLEDLKKSKFKKRKP